MPKGVDIFALCYSFCLNFGRLSVFVCVCVCVCVWCACLCFRTHLNPLVIMIPRCSLSPSLHVCAHSSRRNTLYAMLCLCVVCLQPSDCACALIWCMCVCVCVCVQMSLCLAANGDEWRAGFQYQFKLAPSTPLFCCIFFSSLHRHILIKDSAPQIDSFQHVGSSLFLDPDF